MWKTFFAVAELSEVVDASASVEIHNQSASSITDARICGRPPDYSKLEVGEPPSYEEALERRNLVTGRIIFFTRRQLMLWKMLRFLHSASSLFFPRQ